MYQRILVAIDGSETSNRALAAAVHLAKENHSQLRLLHLVEDLARVVLLQEASGYAGSLEAAMCASGQEILDGGLALARAAGVRADSVLCDAAGARLAEVVADVALVWEAELIVVGTQGAESAGRAFMGSNADQILRLAPIPVLSVPPRPAQPEATPFGEAADRSAPSIASHRLH
jgi:nucleotide-binding universal stress UspA family protein